MRILDLFCKAGGAAKGLKDAFHDASIIGVDIKPQKNYPFQFIQADALTYPTKGFNFIWASPPCQAHTVLKGAAWDKANYTAKHPDLIPQTRAILESSGVPYIIENVPGAPLLHPIMLCGSHFGLTTNNGHQLRRHRIFEIKKTHMIKPILAPGPCKHTSPTIGIFGNKARNTGAEKRHYSKPKATRGSPPKDILLTLTDARQAMGCPWMSFAELSEAIPPAYSRFIVSKFSMLDFTMESR